VDLVDQFRGVALERVERAEEAWARVLGTLDDEAARTVHREVHTLKGESKIVSFVDVNTLCHKLEDLLDVARARGYAVDHDFDLAVTMALQLIAMLVTKAAHPTAIDLPGFVRQIDAIVKRYEPPRAGASRSGSIPLRTIAPVRMPGALRDDLGPPAVDAFIEFSVARGPRRDRLRRSWHGLRDLVGIQRAVVSAAQLDKHRASALALARELGKQVEVTLEIATAEVPSEVLEAIDLATLHLVRNAVDHGIAERGQGRVHVRGALRDDRFTLTVQDDGRGIDVARVMARAVELGLAPAGGAPLAPERLVDLLSHPGFSTRSEPGEVSGRGVGLDAVRGSAAQLGGTLAARSEAGRGTTWTVALPVPHITVAGHAIRAPGLRFPIVMGALWQPLDRPRQPLVVLDLAVALGLAASNSISAHVWTFTDGALEIGLMSGERPRPVQARRLVASDGLAEVCTLDSLEGLLLGRGLLGLAGA